MGLQNFKRVWHSEDGSALLEGTIVVPVLLALVLGALEFSFYFYQQHLVSTGVRDAARYLARTDPVDGTAQSTAQNLAATGVPTGGSNRRVAGFDPGDIAISFTFVANAIDPVTGLRPYREASAECGGPNTLRMIHVTGNHTYSPLGLLAVLGLSLPNISIVHSERCIGPG